MGLARIRLNDKVVVIAGKDKGKTGAVVKVLRTENKVVVSGVNIVKRHTKPTQFSEGGIKAKEMPIEISNVALIDPKDGKPSKVGVRIQDGIKVRYFKRSGEIVDNVEVK